MSAREIKFSADPTEEELLRHWTLSKSDKTQVRSCRGTAQRYSFALQLCILRQRGHFMSSHQTKVPLRILNYVGEQLGFQPTLFLPPVKRPSTLSDQRDRIRSYLQFRPFSSSERERLVTWLKQQERYDLRRSQLNNLAREFLLQRRTIVPAESTLDRLINTEVTRQESISFERLAGKLSTELRRNLENVLDVDQSLPMPTALRFRISGERFLLGRSLECRRLRLFPWRRAQFRDYFGTRFALGGHASQRRVASVDSR